MTKVDIFDFYDPESRKTEFIGLYKFICSQASNEYEILLPTDAGVALMDYGYSAYVGQLLWEVADDFEYFVPEKGIERAVFFRISVLDKEKLVDVLHFILNGYTGEGDDKFVDNSLQYFLDVISEERECACPGIIQKLEKEIAEEEGG